MKKQSKFTTLEDQGKSLRDYSRSLSPFERLEYFHLLISRVYDIDTAKKLSETDVIHISVKREEETLEEFLRKRNKLISGRHKDLDDLENLPES